MCGGRRSYHQDETMSEALQHLMLRDVLACVEASLRDEETPLLQQQDGFNMAYFSTELKRAVKDAVIQLQRMQAQVEADADGLLQARRRPDEVQSGLALAVTSPKLKRCLLALDEDKVFKKQKHRPDEVQSGLALAATLTRNAVQVFRQQVETNSQMKLQLAIDVLHEPLLERPVQP